jgi:hypothetical protein
LRHVPDGAPFYVRGDGRMFFLPRTVPLLGFTDGDKVVLKNGARLVETSVSVQNTDSKNASTSLRLEAENGKMHIKEIRLGGTNTRLVVN